ncbi:MAG: GIY-YIG nuclease family protein [Deinococcales bacterium]
MAIAARWRRLDALPPARGRDAMPGVYELADADRRTIYVGQSARDVPNRLRQHLASGGCVAARAAFWRYRYSRVPQADEAALLAEFRRRHGRLPECNRQTPLERDATRRFRERFSED